MRFRALAFVFVSLTLALVACGTPGQSGRNEAGREQPENSWRVPAEGDGEHVGENEAIAEVSDDKTLALSIPSLDMSIDETPTERGDNTQAPIDNAAGISSRGFSTTSVAPSNAQNA